MSELPLSVEQMAEIIEKDPRYKVIRRFDPPESYGLPDGPVRRALLLDVETTGLDPLSVDIIEFGAVLFEYSPDTGAIYAVLDEYGALNDPGQPIPAEVTELTGITDEMVKGKAYDASRIEGLLSGADLVLAHNAKYDRQVMERFFPIAAEKPWGCTCSQVPWVQLGFGSAKLDYLLYRSGFFTDSHRAVNDCHAAVFLLTRQVNDRPIMSILLEEARKATVKTWAVGAPFDAKDLLKERGYRWSGGENGKPKAWWRDVPEDESAQELAWLAESVYPGGVTESVVMEQITARNRFSRRV